MGPTFLAAILLGATYLGTTHPSTTDLGTTHLGATFVGATAIADQKPVQIGPPQPIVTPDSIKADREKFEREYQLNTKRPWDGLYSTPPTAPETSPLPNPKEK